MGVLSWEELDGVRPFLTGVEVFRGVEDPKPTGVCLYGGLAPPTLPAPDLMLEVRRTPLPRVPSSDSRSSDRFDPVLDGGLDPFLDPGPPPGWVDCLRVKPAMVSGIPPSSCP